MCIIWYTPRVRRIWFPSSNLVGFSHQSQSDCPLRLNDNQGYAHLLKHSNEVYTVYPLFILSSALFTHFLIRDFSRGFFFSMFCEQRTGGAFCDVELFGKSKKKSNFFVVRNEGFTARRHSPGIHNYSNKRKRVNAIKGLYSTSGGCNCFRVFEDVIAVSVIKPTSASSKSTTDTARACLALLKACLWPS